MIRPTKPSAIDLDALCCGETGQVESLIGPESIRRRLLEMGFVPGSQVRYVMPTPFGDPRVYALRGANIALRRAEARCIRLSV